MNHAVIVEYEGSLPFVENSPHHRFLVIPPKTMYRVTTMSRLGPVTAQEWAGTQEGTRIPYRGDGQFVFVKYGEE